MRSSQRSVCDTVSEAVSQAQGRASRFVGNVLLGMAGQDEEVSSRANTAGVSAVGGPYTIKLKLSNLQSLSSGEAKGVPPAACWRRTSLAGR